MRQHCVSLHVITVMAQLVFAGVPEATRPQISSAILLAEVFICTWKLPQSNRFQFPILT